MMSNKDINDDVNDDVDEVLILVLYSIVLHNGRKE